MGVRLIRGFPLVLVVFLKFAVFMLLVLIGLLLVIIIISGLILKVLFILRTAFGSLLLMLLVLLGVALEAVVGAWLVASVFLRALEIVEVVPSLELVKYCFLEISEILSELVVLDGSHVGLGFKHEGLLLERELGQHHGLLHIFIAEHFDFVITVEVGKSLPQVVDYFHQGH